MNWFARVLIWCGILVALTMLADWIPKKEHELHLFVVLCVVSWLIISGLWIGRSVLRIVIR
jgi:hypothetical protein